ncbi:uncharacterized protein LOC127240395 [Andrographis paniculata]|uniref:uncharacterized protein LOC127240395 n=1 Tax=Andrographis paniculata TaxID=175694 RepID=UPI0021E76186|nr:uncharacterized protein LOC127240395 [Andrographis paniculata]
MNRWGYQQTAMVRGCVVDGVVCPKPRRIGAPLQLHEPLRQSPRLLYINQQPEACDAKVGMELLDIIRMKGSYTSERSGFQVASSPPFFAGTPPGRVSNPVIHDEKFGNNNGYSSYPMRETPSSSNRTCGGCVETKFGSKPAVRIEGFDCHGGSRLSAIA